MKRTLYAINRQGKLLLAEIDKNARFVTCPSCGRGVPIERRCHGWHLTLQKPADRRVRLDAIH